MIASFAPPTRRRRAASAAAFAALAAVGLTAAGPPDGGPGVPPSEPAADPAPPPVAGTAPDEEPAGGDADAVPTPCWIGGSLMDARTGEPLAVTADGRPMKVVATAPDGFRAIVEVNGEEGRFRIAVPRNRVRLTTDPPLPLVGTQNSADATDATGATFLYEGNDAGKAVTLAVLPTWETRPRPHPEERDAVAAVEALGGSVELDEDGRVVEVLLASTWRYWRWSDSAEGTSESAVAFSTKADAAPLLGRFPHLRKVNAQRRQITDAGLAAAGPLPELRSFALSGKDSEEAFTVEGLRTLLAAAPKLEYLLLEYRGPEFERALRANRPPSLTRADFAGPPEDKLNTEYPWRRLDFPADDADDAAADGDD